MDAGRGRRVVVALVALSCTLVLAAACSAKLPSAVPKPAEPLASTTSSTTPRPTHTTPAKPAGEVPGGIRVAWTVRSGTARQDPMGVLSSTVLVRKGDLLRASKTVTFRPQVGGATNTSGKYVYTLDLKRSGADPLVYKGKMRVDWTMTIGRPGSKNEFHSVYYADATARYEEAGKKLTQGSAKGTSITTDTYWSGTTKATPNRRVDPFEWSFSSQ